MRFLIPILFSFFLISAPIRAQKINANYRLNIQKASSPIAVDGMMDEQTWQEAEVVKMTDALLAGGAGTERSVLNPLYAELRATLIARYTELKVPNSTDVASAHARWTARDALDRTLIRRGLNAAQEVFF